MRLSYRLPAMFVILLAGCARSSTTGAAAPTRGRGDLATIAPAKPGCPPLARLDSAGLMTDVFRIADDSMAGRAPGSTGAAKSRDYFASKFDALGLGILPPGRGSRSFRPPRRLQGRGIKTGANIVGVVRGTRFPGSVHRRRTAHWDHLGIRAPINGDSIYNGADDNGSGAAGLITLAKYFVRAKPAHSIVFAEVDGEESGMWGSKYFVNTPTVPLDKIMIDVNLDMVGRNVKGQLYAAGTHKYTKLEPMVEAVSECSPISLMLGHDDPANRREDWTGQSDQGVFDQKGIQFIYFGEEDHPDYHKPSDHADKLQPGFYVAALRTVVDFIQRFDAAPIAR